MKRMSFCKKDYFDKCDSCKRNIKLYTKSEMTSIRYLEPNVWVDNDKIVCYNFINKD